MIRSHACAGFAIALLLTSTRLANAAEPSTTKPEAKQEDTTLERHRTPFEVLSERMLGTASQPVRFDWRKKDLGVGILGSQLLELNNFRSARAGASIRTPLGDVMAEFAVTRVMTWGSPSTEKLALTPYRQVGRPDRFELDFNFAYPLAEGVATARPGFVPATQIVFSAVGGLRYLLYPEVFRDAKFAQVVKRIVAPQLSDREIRNLEGSRNPGMQIDKGRINVLAGLSLDIYFGSGGFISPRAMVNVPIVSSALGWWWELTAGAGWMF